MAKGKTTQSVDQPRWLAAKPSKRWAELFFLSYSVVWIGIVALVIVTQVYEKMNEVGYLALGVVIGAPCFIYPTLFPCAADRGKPLRERFYVKANIWIWILSFIGNYFWTHYFYNILGAKYTFPSYRLNDVPFTLFLITHAYFCFYHALTNMALRRWYTSPTYKSMPRFFAMAGTWVLVGVMAYITAFMETWTIQKFPYYSFKNRDLMYSVGSVVYGIYFIVSFPMFYRLDEDEKEKPWTLSQTAIDAFGACMIVTCLLDFWRIFIGGIVDDPVKQCVPFL